MVSPLLLMFPAYCMDENLPRRKVLVLFVGKFLAQCMHCPFIKELTLVKNLMHVKFVVIGQLVRLY